MLVLLLFPTPPFLGERQPLLLRDVKRIHALQAVELRYRVRPSLNKGKARDDRAQTAFFYQLGQIQDHYFERAGYPAKGVNLAATTIVLPEHALSGTYQKTPSKITSCRQMTQWCDTYHRPGLDTHQSRTGNYLWLNSAEVAQANSGYYVRPIPWWML